MQPIPARVLAACALCAGSVVLGGVLSLLVPELGPAARILVWAGFAGVVLETFGWGTRAGYAIRGQSLGFQIEHVLRCSVMSAIMGLVGAMLGGTVLLVVFEVFFRK